MSLRPWTAAAAVTLLGALLSDWLFTELFLARDSVANIAGALALNALLIGVVALAARFLLPPRAVVVVLRAWILLGFAALAYSILHAGGVALPGWSRWIRLGLVAVAVLVAFALALRMGDDIGERLSRSATLGSLAFVLAPFAWRAMAEVPTVWIAAPAASSAAARHATVFLLLDEMGADAAHPMADMLRQAGLNVSETRLDPAGENTQNAVPAMFSGLSFYRARPCGPTTVCSGTNFLDFSAVRVARPDVHVTGLLLPYCRMAGLASCFQLPLPHEHGSAYRSLAAFYLRRIGVSLPPVPDPPGLNHRLLAMQVDFIEGSRFWTDGGVLYAHLPIPHPPGLDGTTTLDADYAANLDAAQALVRRTAERLRSTFGPAFTLIVTSDHPLRAYWCTGGVYKADGCAVRDSFRAGKVPFIVASPQAVRDPGIASNRDVFKVLNRLAGSAAP